MPTVKLIGTPVFPGVVLPPGGSTVGARRVFSEDLREEHSNQVVGQHSGMCTLVREPGWWLCSAGWTLNDVGPGAGKTGTLVAGALLDFAAGQPPFVVAIVGGTGDFDTIRGTIETKPIPNTDDWDYTLEFTP